MRSVALSLVLWALGISPVSGQNPDPPPPPAGETPTLEVERSRGFAATRVAALGAWGWNVTTAGDSALLRTKDGRVLTLRAGLPFVRSDEAIIQLVNAPYLADQTLFVPIQLIHEVEGEPGEDVPSARVVVIDAGHGGRDLGALGYGGTQEKDVALSIALALAQELGRLPRYEVYLTRDADVFIPVWDRGPLATELKGSRPGVFISLHANSNPNSRQISGFETYFLAEARSDHERRMAAIENAPPGENGSGALPGSDLSFILKELINLDHQHWSAHLAGLVQGELAAVHPGRNRGVAQAPLAVITNTLMPAILVEIGFITNAEEEGLLGRKDFHTAAAGALSRAVDTFFEGYPPGTGRPPVGIP